MPLDAYCQTIAHRHILQTFFVGIKYSLGNRVNGFRIVKHFDSNVHNELLQYFPADDILGLIIRIRLSVTAFVVTDHLAALGRSRLGSDQLATVSAF